MLNRTLVAEFLGTLILVVIGCGTAMATDADVVATAFAFGLALLVIAYAFGPVSGAHVNPAVSLGMFLRGRLSSNEMIGYWIAQVAGAIVGAVILRIFIETMTDPAKTAAKDGPAHLLGSNTTGIIGGFSSLLVEIVLTTIFVLAILLVTDKVANLAFAGVAIGFALVMVHMVAIHFTGTSVNPARSIGPALVSGDSDSIKDLWCFIIGPLIGGALAAVIHPFTAGFAEPATAEQPFD